MATISLPLAHQIQTDEPNWALLFYLMRVGAVDNVFKIVEAKRSPKTEVFAQALRSYRSPNS